MVHLVHEVQLKLEQHAVRPSLLNIADDLHALRDRLVQVLHGETCGASRFRSIVGRGLCF